MVISYNRVCMSAGHHAHVPTKWVWNLGENGSRRIKCYQTNTHILSSREMVECSRV